MDLMERDCYALGTLASGNEKSFKHGRNKLSALMNYLQLEEINACRCISALSELSYLFQQNNSNVEFKFTLERSGNEYGLQIDFCARKGDPVDRKVLEGIFHRILITDQDDTIHTQLFMCLPSLGFPLSDDFVDGARKALGRLSEEELLQELTLARDAEAAANRAKSDFLATMSHEIRTPMNGVVGMVEVLGETNLDDYQTDSLETIRKSSFTLLSLIDNILDFSKIEAGRLDLESTEVSVKDIFESTCISLHIVAIDKGVDLFLHVDPQIPNQILSDATRLRQVLYNLVGNAIKFSSGRPLRGKVLVRADINHKNPQQLDFTVTDNGIGMTPEVLSNLFASFTQGEASTTRRFGGTGLGLAISKQLIDLMGGQITVASTPREGTTFTVTLPFEASDERLEPAHQDLLNIECIIVCDPEFTSNSIGVYLEHAGANVFRAPNPEAAFSLAAKLTSFRPIIIHYLNGGSLSENIMRQAEKNVDRIGFLMISAQGNQNRRPRQEPSGIVTLECSVLLQSDLVHAVAIASGRASPEILNAPSMTLHKNAGAQLPSIDEARAQNRLILVAEDDYTNRKVILRQLNILGYVAEIAEDGEQAISLWRTGDYALLLTDLHMPKMDGYELTKAIRQAESPSTRMPILALTANALRGESIRARGIGMDDYLTKPIQLKQLKASLSKWMPLPNNPSEAVASNMEIKNNEEWNIDPLKSLIGDDDKVIHGFLSDYLSQARKQGNQMQEAYRKENFQELGSIAHKLKSSSRAVGAKALGDICAELESACSCMHLSDIEQAIAKLEASLELIEAQIGDFLLNDQLC